MVQSTVPQEDWSLDTGVLLDKVFTYHSTLEAPYDVFPDEWVREPAKVKDLVRRTIMREYWKRKRSSKQSRLPGPTSSFSNDVPIRPTGWVSCFHVTATGDFAAMTTNRFSVLQADEDRCAAQDGRVQQELRRLQD
jgi:hypothetical protein